MANVDQTQQMIPLITLHLSYSSVCGRPVLGQSAKVLEDEVDWQKEEQVDQREKDEEEEVNGDVEAIRETRNQRA